MMKVFMLVWAVDIKIKRRVVEHLLEAVIKRNLKRIFMKFRKPINGWHFYMI